MTPFEQPFRIFSDQPIVAFITTRAGGVSPAPYNSLNLAYLTADQRANVRANRERLASGLGITHDELLIGRQVHGSTVNRAEEVELGETRGDGIVLSRPGSAAMVVIADCLPLLFYDPPSGVAAVAHAGWRGLSGGVLPATLSRMVESGAGVASTLVGVGPGIGACCYEVGPEVVAGVDPQGPESRQGKNDRSFLDLTAIARRQLESAGVRPENIEIMDVCTRCNSDTYFSSRAGEPTGRSAAGIRLGPGHEL